jgi:hypothetical protein
VNDQPLDANAILARILAAMTLKTEHCHSGKSSQDPSHPQTDPFLEVRPGENDGRVFSSQFQSDRGQIDGRGHGDLKI